MSAPTANDQPPSDATIDAPTLDAAATLNLTAQQVRADQRQSWLRGRRVAVEDYLTWVPALSEDPDAVVDLIVREFLLREELGERPTPADFLARFPQFGDRLRRKFQADSHDHDTIPTDNNPLCPDATLTVLTAEPPDHGSTHIEEPSDLPAHGSTQVEEPPPEQHGSTQIEEPSPGTSDATAVDAGNDSPLRSQASPTSIIEATEALARELAEREGIGRELTPERAKLVERLKRALHTQSPPAAKLPPGKTVPGYEIIDELGRGAVGVVYKARQIALNRIVALKMVLVGAHASRAMLVRFKAEAEAVASLQHGNIVQIHDIGEHDGLPYFSLEYCAGGSLADRLNGTPLEPQTAAKIVEKLSRGMHYAHGCKVVHRDLKPGNILLHPRDDAGRQIEPALAGGAYDFHSVIYKISDFGLAKRIDEASHTRTGAILGTPSYMSPEQASGRTHDVGPPSDIYALGAILYELLTGRPPFRAATPLDTVVQVINDEPVAPRRLHSGVPADLETIALKCLQKDASKRYPTASELADDLQRYLNGEPIIARPIGTFERAWRWCRRNPVVAGLTGLAATLLIAGTIVSSYFAHQASREAKQSRQSELAALAAKERAQRNSYVAQMNLVQRAWRDVEMKRVRSLLDGQVPLTEGADDFRGLEWNYWDRLANTELAVIRKSLGEKPCVAYSPDGRLLAAAGKGNPIRVFEVATGNEIGATASHSDTVAGLAFLPDGRLISVSTAYEANVLLGADIRLWDPNDFRLLTKHTVSTAEVDKACMSHDGTRLALACRDGEVVVVGATDGATVQRIAGPKTDDGQDVAAVSVALSADNRLVAAGYDNGAVVVRELATEKLWKLPEHSGVAVYSLAFSPDSRRLAVGRGVVRRDSRTYDSVGETLLWEMSQPAKPLSLVGHSASVLSVGFDRRGQRLVSAGNDRTIRVWDANDGASLLVLQGHERAVNAAVFSPDGRCIASTSEDGTTRLWDAATKYDYSRPADETRPSSCLTLSPDGRRMAIGCRGAKERPSSVALVDLLTQQTIGAIPGGRSVEAIAFSPDGRTVVVAIEADDQSTLRVWDAVEGRSIRDLSVAAPSIRRLIFADDGSRLVVAGQDRIIILSNESWEELERYQSPAGAIADVVIPDTGELRAISIDGNRAVVWDARGGVEPRVLAGHAERVVSAALSSDGQYAATGSSDRTAQIWDAETGNSVLPLTGHVGTVAAVAFNPDGSRLATVGEEFDRTTRIWDRVTGQELLVLESSPGQNSRVAFGRNGERIAVLREGITVWDARPLRSDSRSQRAALAALRFHMARSSNRSEARAAIALDPALSPAARKTALSLVDDWPNDRPR